MLIKVLFILFSIFISGADIKKGAVPRIVYIFAFPSLITLKILLKQQNQITPLFRSTGFVPEYNQLLDSVIGAITGLLIFMLVYIISGKKLGLADVWYSALIGLVLGPWWWYGAIFSACVAGVVYILIAKKRLIPFIPFMALGSIAMYIIQGV